MNNHNFHTERLKIIDKIRAMYAKGRDAASTKDEAEAFMTKAHEMLVKYNIEEYELGIATDITSVNGLLCKVSTDLLHIRRLAQFTADYYFCALAWGKTELEGRGTKQPYYVFVGKPHNRVVAKEMFEYLLRSCRRRAVIECKTPKERNAFVKGMVLQISKRLYDLITDRDRPSKSTGKELVLLTRDIEQAQAFIEKKFELNALIAAVPSISEENRQGWEAGKDVALNAQITKDNERKEIY